MIESDAKLILLNFFRQRPAGPQVKGIEDDTLENKTRGPTVYRTVEWVGGQTCIVGSRFFSVVLASDMQQAPDCIYCIVISDDVEHTFFYYLLGKGYD